jgi:choline dehydrogenase-like flavoprotein
MPATETFDVVSIGAGVAGALIADALAAKKVKVLLLEAGETGHERSELVWAAATVKGLGQSLRGERARQDSGTRATPDRSGSQGCARPLLRSAIPGKMQAPIPGRSADRAPINHQEMEAP